MNDNYLDRHTPLFRDLFEEGYSGVEAKEKYCMSLSAISKLKVVAKSNGWTFAPDVQIKRERRAKMRRERPLSKRHAFVGLCIYRYREEEQLSSTDMSTLMNVGRGTLIKMMRGTHDYTLQELDRISKFIGVDFEKLFDVTGNEGGWKS